MRLRLALFGLTLALLVSASPALGDKRVALLIGNGEYRNVTPLANPHNDVRLLKRALDEAGFDDVTTAFDLGQRDLVKALRGFTDEASDADIALVYYSGHGMEMGGANYLVPVDAALASDLDVSDETVALDRVLQAMDGAKRLKLVILDACRTNPFLAAMKIKGGHRAIEKGLAPVEPPDADTLVAFAAKAGTPALDGEGDDSPFAVALARRLVTPGVDVQFALREVRDDVLAATRKRQEPFTYGSLGGVAIPLSKALVSPNPEAPRPDSDAGAAALDAAMAAHTIAALDGFLAGYPAGPLADIARSERERISRLAEMKPAPIASAGCTDGPTAVSLAMRAARPLSTAEECVLKPKDVFKECDSCPDMVVIPAGSFVMGSPESEKYRNSDEGPQHIVTIAKPLAVGKFDVTVGQFTAFVDAAHYDVGFKCWGPGAVWSERQDRSWRNPGFPQSSSHPVVCLSFNDAIAYVAWLTRKTGRAYRLLAESEWEYSARARTESGDYPRYFFGDDESDLCRYGNVLDQTKRSDVIGIKGLKFAQCKTGFAYTSSVGSFAPNGFGLFDMEGNAWTWTEDCYHDNYIQAPTDGAAWTSGDCNNRVLRGASWVDNSTFLRAAKRFPWYSLGRASNVGFRVERVLSR